MKTITLNVNVNVRHVPKHRFKPDFFERVVIAEALSYENLSLLPLANILIKKEILLYEQEVILFMGDDNIKFLMKNVNNEKIEGIMISSPDYFDESSSPMEKRKIAVRRLPWSKEIFYKENSHEWCFCLPGQIYNSKLDIYGKWRDGLHEHLNRIMTGFLHARKNQYHLD
ncbi:hypothetical protein [Dickeya chrysanthemi]|uniref:hypothetical protein n=1 Tax=Dickeya chrysanthemi TaxID=556 RepID=UPI000587D591|nr:hypothetical protein [Dickeya chrysanthemi]MBX9446765.1 hypothetical protein [Dickeya chrysanthemi]